MTSQYLGDDTTTTTWHQGNVLVFRIVYPDWYKNSFILALHLQDRHRHIRHC